MAQTKGEARTTRLSFGIGIGATMHAIKTLVAQRTSIMVIFK
jgi:hypothetical protein